MMKNITAKFHRSLRAFLPLILIVLMLCPASFAGAVRTAWSKTDSLQKTLQTSTVRRAENPAPVTVFSNPTTTGVTSSADPSVYGQSVTFTATVSTAGLGTPTGNVQFFDMGNPIGGPVALNASGRAQFTTSALSVGTHTITAEYQGNVPAGFNPSSGSLNTNPQTVNKASTTTGISSSSNPVGTGVLITFTATVSPVAPGAGTRTGTVTFNRNGLPLCSNLAINAGGQATCTISFGGAGNYNITAVYSGDTNFNASDQGLSPFVQQVVGPSVGDTTTGVSSSRNPSVIGQSVTFTAFVFGTDFPGLPVSGGYVQFYDGPTPLGGLVLVNAVTGQAQVTTSALSLGNHTITAQFLTNFGGGAQGYNPSTGTLFNGQTVTLAPTAAPVYIKGRIVTITGRGIARARVTMIDSGGQARYSLTNSSGYYRFAEIPAGGVYIFTVRAKGYQTEEFVRTLNDSIADLNVVLDRP